MTTGQLVPDNPSKSKLGICWLEPDTNKPLHLVCLGFIWRRLKQKLPVSSGVCFRGGRSLCFGNNGSLSGRLFTSSSDRVASFSSFDSVSLSFIPPPSSHCPAVNRRAELLVDEAEKKQNKKKTNGLEGGGRCSKLKPLEKKASSERKEKLVADGTTEDGRRRNVAAGDAVEDHNEALSTKGREEGGQRRRIPEEEEEEAASKEGFVCSPPPLGHPPFLFSTADRRMPGEVRLPRTRALLLGLLLAVAACGGVEVDLLGDMVFVEADDRLGGELEASMTSSLLGEFQEASDGIRPMEAADVAAARQNPSTPTTFPDSSAMVGRIFQMKVPNKMEDILLGDIVKITEMGKDSLPSWLHWDAGSRILQGLPLDEDKGVHYISVSISNHTKSSSSSEVFSIEVHPEDHPDVDSAQTASNQASAEDDVQPFMCANEEPVTVLTVILDADLTKMSSEQRVELLDNMRSFSGVELQHMKILPVVNNRLFDMSAFMAGPGNAKKVVENGALLSWKLGCSLDQSTVPNINSVQGPAKEGAMSAMLGYPVVGWHIANKKPHVPKRVRRQLNNTPTPVLAVLPPTTVVEPPVRIIPTLSSPSIAAPTESSAPPVRGPVPLPGKPTIRVRDPIAHTPTLGPPQPTRVLESTSTLPIQPTMTRPTYVEATATPPSPTRRPTKKPKRPKTTPVSREPKTSTAKPPRRTTPAPGVVPDPYNEKPVLRNPIDQVNALVGTYFEVKIPSDTFFDKEDGTTDKLRLTLRQNHNEVVGESSWIQFNTTSQLLYGLPDVQHVGKHEYFMQATDKGGLNVFDAIEVHVNRWPANDKTPVIFTARFDGEPRSVTNDIHKKILLVKKLAYALGDRNSSTVSLRNITKGSIVVEWTNTSLPQHPCPKEQLQIMSRTLADADGRPSQTFRYSMEPEFRPLDVNVKGRASCRAYSFVPPREIDIPEPPAVTPGLGSSRHSTDDVYLHTVIPAVVVAAILLIAGIIAMICYRKKRKGKLTIEDQATFIKKGVPIIFADELDDSKPPPSSSMPLILQEEKPPLPPPEYPNMATPETTPLNQELLGEYTALRDEDPNAPPYQPPPPFTTPMEGKGSRPKNMTPYRSPPPYVPP